jgi:hypothetical protein
MGRRRAQAAAGATQGGRLNIYDEALYVQDACNPSGVTHFLLKCIKHIRDVENVTDTALICCHPLFVLVVNKLDSLAGDTTKRYPQAYAACKYRSVDHDHHPNDKVMSESLPGHPEHAAKPKQMDADRSIPIPPSLLASIIEEENERFFEALDEIFHHPNDEVTPKSLPGHSKPRRLYCRLAGSHLGICDFSSDHRGFDSECNQQKPLRRMT